MLTMENEEVPFHLNSKLVFKSKALLNVLGCTAQVEYHKTALDTGELLFMVLETHVAIECYKFTQ